MILHRFTLPEFKTLQVGVEKINAATGNPELSLEPAQRQMTLKTYSDTLRGSPTASWANPSSKRRTVKQKFFDPNQTLAQFVTKLSKLPLAHQPGTTWDYSMSTDVLGRIVEVVSGVPFDQFIADRIVKPLGLPTRVSLSPRRRQGVSPGPRSIRRPANRHQ